MLDIREHFLYHHLSGPILVLVLLSAKEKLVKKIVVFYDSADLAVARKVAHEIKATEFSPWLADDDSKLDWHTEVEELVASDDCVGAVVIWSESSKSNSVVRDEAKEVASVKKPLLGLLMNGTNNAPFGLRDGPRHLLEFGANGTVHSELRLKLNTVFGGIDPKERTLVLNGKKLFAPEMVLSVSSFETQIEPDATLSLLSYVNPPAVLVSAFDLLRPKPSSRKKPPSRKSTIKPKITNVAAIDRLRKSGSLVFLDSGNYEAMRYQDPNWKRGKRRLLEAREIVDVDLAFTHDRFPKETSLAKVSAQCRIDEVSEEYGRDRSLIGCAVAPIVHAPRLLGGKYCYDRLPEICCGVVRAVDPPMIAVAERELGDGIMERICTVAKIRKALSDQGSTTLLHLLGTGNPITMAFLSMAGADFFDGLEWCRTSIDGKTWRLYHFQQWDIFASQTGEITSPEIAALIKNQTGTTPWFIKVAFHNMAFFMQASEEIRNHHNKNAYERLFHEKELWVEFKLAKEKMKGLF